ncbi:hypothetical protein [Posidoniimonas polymericola]|uniref:hypothetical protein n=1 Tax=Posidoniimonas polymericola TaxID=2528002 RepID=UPI001E3BEF54|nr:hypothetical protein [Posidoniimonas polymericola]
MILASAFGLFLAADSVLAYKQFQDAFVEMYLDEHPDADFVKMCRKKAKCNICHQGKKKHNNNPYGEAFVGKLTKKDRKDEEKIVQALLDVGGLKANPDDENSPTYAELIASSKLPAGDLDSVKQEPENDEHDAKGK